MREGFYKYGLDADELDSVIFLFNSLDANMAWNHLSVWVYLHAGGEIFDPLPETFNHSNHLDERSTLDHRI